MQADKEWDLIRPERYSRASEAGIGILRITLLFGFAAIALALIATPYIEGRSRSQYGQGMFGGLDLTSTGSISRNSNYTLRKSVLQKSPDAVCIILENGARRGDC